jgi:hypothetical protein
MPFVCICAKQKKGEIEKNISNQLSHDTLRRSQNHEP